MDRSVLQRIAEGDLSAVDKCVECYGGLVWTLANKFCATAADAEDATQDIFLEIWQKAKQFDPLKASETTFISLIARRRLIDRYRRTRAMPETISMAAFSLDLPGQSEDNEVEVFEEASKALRCLRKLNDDQQKILTMSIHEGRSHSVISEALKLPLGTVKSYARRGLLQLRDCMNRNLSTQTRGGIR